MIEFFGRFGEDGGRPGIVGVVFGEGQGAAHALLLPAGGVAAVFLLRAIGGEDGVGAFFRFVMGRIVVGDPVVFAGGFLVVLAVEQGFGHEKIDFGGIVAVGEVFEITPVPADRLDVA